MGLFETTDGDIPGGFFALVVEGDQLDNRFIALAEAARPGPLQVEGLVGADIVRLLTDDAIRGHGTHRDAPTSQRIWHGEAEFGLAIGTGLHAGGPERRVLILAAWPLQHLDAALVEAASGDGLALIGQRHVVGDEVQAGGGAYVVATWMIEEVVDIGGQLRLQQVDHLVDHADHQLRRNRLAGDQTG